MSVLESAGFYQLDLKQSKNKWLLLLRELVLLSVLCTNYKQEVLGRINPLISFDTTLTA
jgi:hypothetical protein